MAIRIVLADDRRLFRAGLRALIEKQTDMEVVAEADNGRLAVELVEQLHPEVVVMDISMPDLNGIEAARQIVSNSPGTKVISLSMHTDRQFVEGMLQAGASGYILKDCAHDEFIRAIRTVVEGQVYLTPAVTSQLVEEYVHKAPAKDALQGMLTP